LNEDVTEKPLMSQFQIVELAEELALLLQPLAENTRPSQAFKKGDQVSPYRGSGLEYEESRLYQAGDEIRHLNWRLMARTGKAYSKVFQEERQEQWVIVLDMRQSMRFGTRERLKVTQGLRVAGYYAWLAQQKGFPLSGLTLADTVSQTPIFEGNGTYESLMHAFSQPCPPCLEAAEPNLADVLQELQPQLQPGARLIIISDFHDMSEQALWLLSSLQSCVRVKAVHIHDSSERELPEVSGVVLESLDGNAQLDLANSEARLAYQQWAERYFSDKMLQFKRANIVIKPLQTDDPLSRLSSDELPAKGVS
jgi:uncharacterized protein (DUF58 family)